jgi:hypothetical protein
MKKMRFVISAGLFLILAIFAVSCEKNELSPATASLSEEEITLAKDDIVADDIFDDVDAVVTSEIRLLEENNYQPTTLKSTDEDFTCLVVTVDYPDSTRFPKVITMDYGEGCTFIIHDDTITKKGAMVITLTDKFFNPGAQHIVTFQDYFVNDVKVEGIITSTFVGVNENELLEYTLTVEGGKLIYDESTVYTREARHKKEWLRSPEPIEDTIYISGSMWGVNIEGEDYSREITVPLILAHCPSYGRRWVIVDGQVVSTVGDQQTVIDYSDGSCDGTAVIRREGAQHRIRIRERHRNRNHTGK